MPRYDYKCKKCGAEFFKVKSIHSKTRKAKCPGCGKFIKPKIGTPAFKVKGGTPKFYGK